MLKKMSLLALSLALAACSNVPKKYQVFRDNSQDYLNAQALPPLKIPPGYSSSSFEAYYPIPNAVSSNQPITPPRLLPPDINPKQAPPKESWWKKWIPHAHMPWDPPGK